MPEDFLQVGDRLGKVVPPGPAEHLPAGGPECGGRLAEPDQIEGLGLSQKALSHHQVYGRAPGEKPAIATRQGLTRMCR